MKFILPVILLLTACQNDSGEVAWFVGSWVSDPELTIQENSHFSKFEPDDIEAVRTMLGSLRWEVTDSTLTVIRPELETRTAFEYSLDNITKTQFNFLSDAAGDMIIRKIDGGICADFTSQPGAEPLLVSECFAQYDS